MFKRKIVTSVLLLGAVAGAYAAVKLLKDDKEDVDEELDDNEIHFINISDEEVRKPYDVEGRDQSVKEVAAMYPYLDPDFIEEMLSKKEELNKSFNEDTLVTVSHKVDFKMLDRLEEFTKIMEEAGYEVESDELNVVVSRKLFTEDDAILSDVLNVANQAAVLYGEYLENEVKE